MRLIHHDPSRGARSRSAERFLVIRRLRAAFDELDHELCNASRLRWIMGAPFVRLDRARSLRDCSAHVFSPVERAELVRAFGTYSTAFDAIAAEQHSRGGADAQDSMNRRQRVEEVVEAARAAARAVCASLSGPKTCDVDVDAPAVTS